MISTIVRLGLIWLRSGESRMKIVAAITAHHHEPNAENGSICTLVQVSWRLVDKLGYRAYAADLDLR